MIDQLIIRSYESLEIEEVNTVRHWDETEKREMIKESQNFLDEMRSIERKVLAEIDPEALKLVEEK